MRINFDLVIDCPGNTVDMKVSLQSMQGVSDAIRTISETIVNDVVPERKTLNDDMRTELENSFTGSYGQNFSLVTYSEKAEDKITSIGEKAVVELINYYLAEALFQDYPELSESASKVVEELGITSDKLVNTLRNGTLQRAHTVPNTLDYDVIIHHKNDKKVIETLQVLNKETYAVLVPKKDKKTVNLFIAVTRLNIFTGNGRCKVKNDNSTKTIAFGFIKYKALSQTNKKIFSTNLDLNNGLEHEEVLTYIKVKARALVKNDGEVVKYIIESILDE